MGDKMWLLTRGSYSDFEPLAVFATEEAALRAKEAGLGEDVESIPLNPELVMPPEGYRRVCIEMTRDGDVKYCKEELFQPDAVAGIMAIKPSYLDWAESRSVFFGTVWAKDETHAIKIANELRAQQIAMEVPQ
jgi:hypothetical protein